LLASAPHALKLIVASRFGWAAVSDEPMDHHDFLMAAQLIAEQDIGKLLREQEREEQQQMRRNRENMKR
jgi:hypothetical protein